LLAVLLMVLASVTTICLHNHAMAQPINQLTEITIEPELYEEINERYLESTDEFVYCLYANVDGTKAHITKIYLAHLYSTGAEHVSFGMCSPFADDREPSYIDKVVAYYIPRKQQGHDVYIGTIHNHPNLYPLLSLQDVYTFGMMRDMSMGIISGHNQMNMYTPKEFIDGIKLSVA